MKSNANIAKQIRKRKKWMFEIEIELIIIEI